MPPDPVLIATRKSPLALVQAGLVATHLAGRRPGTTCRLVEVVTTGDRQASWSLEKKGGRGLFTAELEEALRLGRAHLAAHSAKDLPGTDSPGLPVAGFLPRADPRDVLVLREGVSQPRTLATGSPRRRLQLARLFPEAAFTEIRGNVDTRLRRIAGGGADGTVLAAAGLARLGITGWPGLSFCTLSPAEMVPAVGQGAIAAQTTEALAPEFAGIFDENTARCVRLERAFLRLLGGGCHTAFAAHVSAGTVHVFHESTGIRSLPLNKEAPCTPEETAAAVLLDLGLPHTPDAQP